MEFAKDQNPLAGRHVMVITAHPDDETIGAGACLADAERISLVQVTDGARSAVVALSRGFTSRRRYRQAREEELLRALSILRKPVEWVRLEIRDQHAAFHIADIARRLGELIATHKPDIVLTHAFEGAHPDHDAVAMAAYLALRSPGLSTPQVEITGYHRLGGSDTYGCFLSRSDASVIHVGLSADQRAQKRAMLACFISQRSIVSRFGLDQEVFRIAPRYDFNQRPHEGTLYYEKHRLLMRWSLWRVLVRRALDEFEHGARTHPADGLRRTFCQLQSFAPR